MFRVLLAAYLVVFACVLPALHTCEPVQLSSGSEAAGPDARASGDPHDEPGHPRSHDDLCVICHLSRSSGGVSASPAAVFETVPPVADHLDPQRPPRPALFILAAILPRAPPA